LVVELVEDTLGQLSLAVMAVQAAVLVTQIRLVELLPQVKGITELEQQIDQERVLVEVLVGLQ
jgi:hypothetical protein